MPGSLNSPSSFTIQGIYNTDSRNNLGKMAGLEPGWEQVLGATNAYSRPLLASEIWTDRAARFEDGLSQFAIGVQFTTSIHERDIETRVKEAVLKLRFECPLIAATIERGAHQPEFGCWVYAPLANVESARTWVDKAVHYVPDPVDPASFLVSTVEKNKIPYILADGSEQYFRVYVTRPDSTLSTYCLFLHSTHSIIDARPGLNALSLLLEWMTTPGLESVAELTWGMEYKNLPAGPVTVTGGPREDWDTNGKALVDKFMAVLADETPTHGLDCDRSDVSSPQGAHRLIITFSAQESAKITQAVKRLGFTFSELVDAARVLATFELNPVPAEKVATATVKGGSLVAITDRLPPTVDRRKHLVSCMLFTPFRIDYAPLASLSGKARLVAAMRQAKDEYDKWLEDPCLPHLFTEIAPRIAPTKEVDDGPGPYAPAMTNVGRVENYVATVWPRDVKPGEVPVIRVDQMHLACRMGSKYRTPTMHAWSMQGRLSIMLQAADVWKKDVLQDLINEVARQISFVMAE